MKKRNTIFQHLDLYVRLSAQMGVKVKKKLWAFVLIAAMIGTLNACSVSTGSEKETNQSTTAQSPDSSKETAEESAKAGGPLEPYKDTVTIHLGVGLNPNVSFPEGQSIEKNAFLDAIKKDLNIEIVYDWVSSNTDFQQKMNLCIGSNTLPDIMNVGSNQFRAMLKYGQLLPLTDAYNNYASEMLKSFVSSGGDQLTDMITKDGQMMAVPAPNIKAGGVNVMWIRQDWLDKLGLEVPKSLEDLKTVAKAFVTQDPDGNGKDDTIGIIGPANSGSLAGIGGNLWGLDPIFGAFKSFPQYWMKDESGEIKYGSIQPEIKDSLKELASMYDEGLIDPQMLIRDDSSEPVLAGNAGIFFGPWWAGYTVADSLLSGKIDWQAYNAPLASDGKYYAHMAEPTSQYIVVNKNCKNPEAAMKIINYLLYNEPSWVKNGIGDSGITPEELDTSDVYPLFNVYDNADEIEVSYETLKKFVNGEITEDDVDFSTHKLLKNDMEAIKALKKEPLDDYSLKYWDLSSDLASTNLPRLVSIMVGERPSVEAGYEEIYSAFYGQTETMESKWSNLKKMEDETFAKIIMGQASIDSFDDFVNDWKKQGGDKIVEEIKVEINK